MSYPMNPFTIYELSNPSYDVPELYIKFVDPRILRLKNWERARRVNSISWANVYKVNCLHDYSSFMFLQSGGCDSSLESGIKTDHNTSWTCHNQIKHSW